VRFVDVETEHCVWSWWLAWMVADGIDSVDSRSTGSGRAARRDCILKLLRGESCRGRGAVGAEGANTLRAPDRSHDISSDCCGAALLSKSWTRWSLSP
jgi:hypothetical protein